MFFKKKDKRRTPRAVFPCLTKLSKGKEPDDVILTHTRNISPGGVCLKIERPLAVFSEVGLMIDLMDGGPALSCRGRVVWSRLLPRESGDMVDFYDTGIELFGLKATDLLRVERAVLKLIKTKE